MAESIHAIVSVLIDALDLRQHPEGGFYREIYRSPALVQPHDDRPPRSAITTIYFLLDASQHSSWHRVQSDEIWHFYEGEPLEILLLDPLGERVERHLLGPTGHDTAPVVVVPAGYWQAARPLGSYTLAGCSVGPGFDFADFQLLRDHPETAAQVQTHMPDLADLI